MHTHCNTNVLIRGKRRRPLPLVFQISCSYSRLPCTPSWPPYTPVATAAILHPRACSLHYTPPLYHAAAQPAFRISNFCSQPLCTPLCTPPALRGSGEWKWWFLQATFSKVSSTVIFSQYSEQNAENPVKTFNSVVISNSFLRSIPILYNSPDKTRRIPFREIPYLFARYALLSNTAHFAIVPAPPPAIAPATNLEKSQLITHCYNRTGQCGNFSKVSSLVVWYRTLITAQTFEKFYL